VHEAFSLPVCKNMYVYVLAGYVCFGGIHCLCLLRGKETYRKVDGYTEDEDRKSDKMGKSSQLGKRKEKWLRGRQANQNH